MPEIISRQVSDGLYSKNCVIHLSWKLPSNIAPEDISHFAVHINGVHMANETRKGNESSILIMYRLCSCGSQNISISAINRCGSVSRKNLTVQDHFSLSQLSMKCQDDGNPTTVTYNYDRNEYQGRYMK